MKFISNILVLILLVLPGCSGVDSVTKKRYQNTENTIVLKDLTVSDFDLQDAGSQLQSAIEDAMAAINNTLNRVNEVYERESAIRLILIENNDLIIYTNSSSDPYSKNFQVLLF